MDRARAAGKRQVPGAARMKETEDVAGRSAALAGKTKPEKTSAAEIGAIFDPPAVAAPHPVLVEMVRLLARADARRAQAEAKETR